MQNKPNLRDNGMNITSLLLTTNDQRLATREAQNKPNQTQFHPHRLYHCFNFLLWDIVRPKLCRDDSKISLIPNTQITPNTDNLREWGLSRGLCVSKYVCGKVWRTRFFALLSYKRQNMAQKKSQTIEPAVREESIGLADDTVEQLKMAGQVQRYFLPAQLPNSDTLRWATVFAPADWVSGDIYDIARLDEQHIGFYVADAVGHSMPAALLTMFLKHAIIMRQTTGNEYKIFSPAEVITELNNKMLEQNLSGCLFATCCYCLLNIATLEVSYARAGHPYPVLLRPDAAPQQLQSRGGLLGVFEDVRFEQKTVYLAPGSWTSLIQ